MDAILIQIERGLDRGFHYLAVTSALTLPDICGALESADGIAHKERYKTWVEMWLLPKYPQMTSEDLYRLRSGAIHQGRFGPGGMQYDRVIFTLAGGSHGNISRNNGGTIDSALQLSARTFCLDMTDAVRRWYAAKEHEPQVKKNIDHVLRVRPDGLAPHWVGQPLIA